MTQAAWKIRPPRSPLTRKPRSRLARPGLLRHKTPIQQTRFTPLPLLHFSQVTRRHEPRIRVSRPRSDDDYRSRPAQTPEGLSCRPGTAGKSRAGQMLRPICHGRSDNGTICEDPHASASSCGRLPRPRRPKPADYFSVAEFPAAGLPNTSIASAGGSPNSLMTICSSKLLSSATLMKSRIEVPVQ